MKHKMTFEYDTEDIKEYMRRYAFALAEHLCSKYDIRNIADMSDAEFIKIFNEKCINFVNEKVQMYRDREYKRRK